MCRLVRILIAWVMVVSMPVQGMTASTRLLCPSGHGAEGHARSSASVDPATLHHGARERVGGQRPIVDASAAGLDVAGAIDSAAGAKAGIGTEVTTGPEGGCATCLSAQQHGQFGCSACAACCVALALPGSFMLPVPSGPARVVRLAPLSPMASHQPDTLKRPPRSSLA